MAREKRVQETKGLLYQALLRLLETVQLDALSISDICREARVTRSTFYRYYQSVYDLLLEVYKSNIENFEKSLAPGPLHDRERLNGVLQIIQKGPRHNLALNEMFMHECLRGRLVMAKEDNFRRIFLDRMSPTGALYFGTILTAVLQQWILCGMQEATDKIADMLISIATATNEWYEM